MMVVPGEYTDVKVVNEKFRGQLSVIRAQQNAWFKNLVDIADDTWSKIRSPLGIFDLQRTAARSLNLNREWLVELPPDTPPIAPQLCPVCKSQVNPGALKCMHCGHVINKVEYDKLVGATK
jgi:hypothetical protein